VSPVGGEAGTRRSRPAARAAAAAAGEARGRTRPQPALTPTWTPPPHPPPCRHPDRPTELYFTDHGWEPFEGGVVLGVLSSFEPRAVRAWHASGHGLPASDLFCSRFLLSPPAPHHPPPMFAPGATTWATTCRTASCRGGRGRGSERPGPGRAALRPRRSRRRGPAGEREPKLAGLRADLPLSSLSQTTPPPTPPRAERRGLFYGFPFCHTRGLGDPYLRSPGPGLPLPDPQLNLNEKKLKCSGERGGARTGDVGGLRTTHTRGEAPATATSPPASLLTESHASPPRAAPPPAPGSYRRPIQALGPHVAPLGLRFYKWVARSRRGVAAGGSLQGTLGRRRAAGPHGCGSPSPHSRRCPADAATAQSLIPQVGDGSGVA
jgi:hypothetical protein